MTQQKANLINTGLLSICTALLSGLFLFCWRTNTQVTLLVDHDTNKTQSIQSIQTNVEKMHSDVTEMQIHLQRVEDKQNLVNQPK